MNTPFHGYTSSVRLCENPKTHFIRFEDPAPATFPIQGEGFFAFSHGIQITFLFGQKWTSNQQIHIDYISEQ